MCKCLHKNSNIWTSFTLNSTIITQSQHWNIQTHRQQTNKTEFHVCRHKPLTEGEKRKRKQIHTKKWVSMCDKYAHATESTARKKKNQILWKFYKHWQLSSRLGSRTSLTDGFLQEGQLISWVKKKKSYLGQLVYKSSINCERTLYSLRRRFLPSSFLSSCRWRTEQKQIMSK